MTITKSFYGFTDNCTPMQAARKKEQLDKYFNDNGQIMRFADFAVMMIFEKSYKPTVKIITEGMINGYWGKEWGKLAKPKTEYRLESDNCCEFYTINKMQYDYCNYIVNAFNSEDEALNFAETERQAQEKAAAEAAAKKARQEQEKQEQNQRKKAHKEWMVAEREQYKNTPIEAMCKAIFDYCYGENLYQPCVDVVILAKDIENPLSRQELIARLHNDNKGSIKIFEHFTGIKLPKNQKERVEFLATVKPEQYSEMVEFKPRAKASNENKTEKQLEKYYKYMRADKNYVEAYGEKINYNCMVFFAEKNGKDKCYTVTEATTGLLLTSDKTLTSISKCKDKIKEFCETKNIKSLVDAAISRGMKSPLYEEKTITA